MAVIFLTNINKISPFSSRLKNEDWSFMEKPFIGFEPMTYALPWRYSTTELKGLQKKNELAIHFSL